MKIKEAEFLCSARGLSQFPERLPEIAFAGRSNVGKSSLINTLLNRKGLAKTSSTPGKTRTINFYRINRAFYMVDLPGYGFAKVSKKERMDWKGLVEGYFNGGRDIRGVILVVDMRRGLEEEEFMVVEWMEYLSIPLAIVLTKADKLSRNARAEQLREVRSALRGIDCEVIPFSSLTKEGRKEVWRVIQDWLGGSAGR